MASLPVWASACPANKRTAAQPTAGGLAGLGQGKGWIGVGWGMIGDVGWVGVGRVGCVGGGEGGC